MAQKLEHKEDGSVGVLIHGSEVYSLYSDDGYMAYKDSLNLNEVDSVIVGLFVNGETVASKVHVLKSL